MHKPTEVVDAYDLLQVCTAWGFDVQTAAFPPFTQEN
jgi:hypothetical protein